MTYYDTTPTGLPDPEVDSQFYNGVPSRRLVAWLFDVIITLALTALVVVFTAGIALLLFPFLWLAVGFIYRTMTISSKSATVGMRMVGIEFRDKEGKKFDFGTALMHTLIYSVATGFIVVQIISVVLMMTTRYQQSIQDMVLGTTAINTPAK